MIDGKIIKKQRNKMNISQKELANNITTQGTISALERNSTSPSSEILAKILDRLSLTLDDVLVADNRILNQRLLNNADKLFMSYQFEETLSLLKNIKETEGEEQLLHFTFLKTAAEMWIKKNYDNAIFGYNLILQKTTNKNNIYTLLATCELGVTYADKNDATKSSFYFEQLPDLLLRIDESQNVFWFLMILSNLSKYYSNTERYNDCLEVLNKGIKFAQKYNTLSFMDSFHFLYATTLRDKEKKWNKTAHKYMLKAWAFADFLDDQLVLKKATKYLKEQGLL